MGDIEGDSKSLHYGSYDPSGTIVSIFFSIPSFQTLPRKPSVKTSPMFCLHAVIKGFRVKGLGFRVSVANNLDPKP